MKNKKRNKIIADNIKELLNKNNMTQTELAKRLGKSKGTISDYISTRTAPSHGVIEEIAIIFGVQKSDIDSTFKIEYEKKNMEKNIQLPNRNFSLENKKDIIIAKKYLQWLIKMETSHFSELSQELDQLTNESIVNVANKIRYNIETIIKNEN